ncbi:MAG: TIGR04149 family rSAM-modified RiPP [Prevotellaceae bacterium]|jgi:natural product precursor|nr:TIGR04149 family rSAM-modified RiPP [Prevotellaceae bacterium]
MPENIKTGKIKKIIKMYKKLKLNVLNKHEMRRINGGGEVGDCCCGCMYAGTPGGSSIDANNSANNMGGLKSRNCATVTAPAPA